MVGIIRSNNFEKYEILILDTIFREKSERNPLTEH